MLWTMSGNSHSGNSPDTQETLRTLFRHSLKTLQAFPRLSGMQLFMCIPSQILLDTCIVRHYKRFIFLEGLSPTILTTWFPPNTGVNLQIYPSKGYGKFGMHMIINKQSVAWSGNGGWGQVLTMDSAGTLPHQGHLQWNTRHNGRWESIEGTWR